MDCFRNMMLRMGVFGLCALIAFFFSCPLQAEEAPLTKTLEIIGTAQSDNITHARQKAISNSLLTAVAMATAELLPLESLIQNFSTLNEIIFNNTNQYIQHYKVLTETRSEKYYRVIVRATIGVDSIVQRLSTAGILLGGKPMPRILFLMVEQKSKVTPACVWQGREMAAGKTLAEEILVQTLQIKGFLEIERADIIPAFMNISLACTPDFINQDAVSLGAQVQADIVVVGKSWVTPAAEQTDANALEATVIARALRVDSGAEIAATTDSVLKTASDKTIAAREALAEAATFAGEALAVQILTEWKKDIKKLIALKIVVAGTGNLANFVIFRRTLIQLPGMKELQTSEMKPDEVTLAAEYQGSAEDLAAALKTQTFDTLQINIAEILSNSLRIELIPGPPG